MEKSGYVDFHAHILPGADHGSASVATSCAQLALAEQAGVALLVATPHFYPDRSNNKLFFQCRAQALQRLTEAYQGPIRILSGAEVFLCEGLQHYERLPELCAAGTRCLLIELSQPPWSARERGTLEALSEAGYTIVLAHIERYPRRALAELLTLPLLAQVNADCLLDPLTQRRWRTCLREGTLCALGSDIHGADKRAYLPYSKAMRRLGPDGETLQRRMRRLLGDALPAQIN